MPPPLSRRPLGATGLQVTPICIGSAPLGNMAETFAYEVAEEQALATIRAFFAGSVNFLDTAAYAMARASAASASCSAILTGFRPASCWRRRPAAICRPASSLASRCGAASSAACACLVWSNYNSSISLTPPPYTRTREDEVHQPGRGPKPCRLGPCMRKCP